MANKIEMNSAYEFLSYFTLISTEKKRKYWDDLMRAEYYKMDNDQVDLMVFYGIYDKFDKQVNLLRQINLN